MAEGRLNKVMELLEALNDNEDSEIRSFNRVFRRMIEPPYRGKVPFNHVSKMSPEDFQPNESHVSLIRWFRSYPDKFAVFEGDNGRVAMFGVRVRNAHICWKSNRQPIACEDPNCNRFHICKKYVGGNCTTARCRLDHHFQSEHSRGLLKRYSLEDFSDADLMTIFRQSHLQTCIFYDRKGTCDHDDRCAKVHICANFVNGSCKEPCPKKLAHDFGSNHSRRLLKVYDLHDRRLEDQLDQLLICDFSAKQQDPKKLTNNEILRLLLEGLENFDNDDEGGACGGGGGDGDDQRLKALRELNLGHKASKNNSEERGSTSEHTAAEQPRPSKDLRKSPKSGKCAKWEMEIFGEWKPLGDVRSRKLETAFCDPKQDSIPITLPDVDDCVLFDTLIDVNLNNLTAALLEGDEKLNLRRAPNTGDAWLWYYETDKKNWDPYPKDDQLLLESAFLVKEKRVVVGKGERYRVKFLDLTQRNRDTGTERRVRRRPLLLDA